MSAKILYDDDNDNDAIIYEHIVGLCSRFLSFDCMVCTQNEISSDIFGKHIE